MRIIKVDTEENNGFYHVMEAPLMEFGNPVEYFRHINFSVSFNMMKNHLELLKFPYPDEVVIPILERRANEDWLKDYKEAIEYDVPPCLFELLMTEKKTDQLKLLNGVILNSSLMMSFIVKAYLDHGFLFSTYSFQHNPTGIDQNEMPRFAIKKEDGSVYKTPTPLTGGQVKSVIDQRHVVSAKFLDKGPIWHCFFTTYKSMSGKENGGRPHYHYISSAFGRSREEVILQLSRKNYKLPKMPHIPVDRNR